MHTYIHSTFHWVETLLTKYWNKIIIVTSLLTIGTSLIFVYQLLGTHDLQIATDRARDFLLMDELSQKGYILTGPRSSAIGGIFHGPLWIYLNYPLYYLSNANPLVVSYGWIALYIALVVSCFICTQRFLKDPYIALLVSAHISVSSLAHSLGMTNPFAAAVIMPIFLITLHATISEHKLSKCIIHLLVTGTMIQFQMAVGAPLLLLTLTVWAWTAMRDAFWKRFVSLPILLIPLSTFILFDLRHNFTQIKSIIYQLSGNDIYRVSISKSDILINRIQGMLEYGWQVFDQKLGTLNIVVCVCVVWMMASITYKKREQLHNIPKTYYLLCIYCLFWVWSSLHNGFLLSFYYYPIMVLPVMLFALSLRYMSRSLGFVLLFLALWSGLNTNAKIFQNFVLNSGNSISSWNFYKGMSADIFRDAPDEFGYFIYAPDILAYQAKWMIRYGEIHHPEKKLARYQKRHITYIISEPPPADQPQFTPAEWKKDKVRLSGKLLRRWCYENGYCVEKWQLGDNDLAIAPDPNIDDWLHYR